MSRQVTSRSQRRLEKKQALMLVVLGLIIALVSYGLGVVVGRSGRDTVIHEDFTVSERIAIPPAVADNESEEGQPGEAATRPPLTFYETLPEGKQPPMGSGINMPVQATEPPEVSGDVLPDRKPEVKVFASKPAPVVVAPEPKQSVATPPKPKAVPENVVADGGYVVQVASVQKVTGADNLSSRLSKSGYSAFVEKTDLGSKGIWYRVYVGPFASKKEADGAVSTLKSSRLASSPLVRKR